MEDFRVSKVWGLIEESANLGKRSKERENSATTKKKGNWGRKKQERRRVAALIKTKKTTEEALSFCGRNSGGARITADWGGAGRERQQRGRRKREIGRGPTKDRQGENSRVKGLH